jgi:hypothetical protein
MSYKFGGENWPKRDPITNRDICHACWNLFHDDCKPAKYECDCVHLSEANFANEERTRSLAARQEKRAMLREQAADENNPLCAVNDGYKPREKKVRA